jgi:hypothetical protein
MAITTDIIETDTTEGVAIGLEVGTDKADDLFHLNGRNINTPIHFGLYYTE